MFDNTHTRRRVILGTGTLAAGTIGSIALLGDNATATVDGDFTIPDGQTALADTELTDVRVSVDATWSYESNAPIHGLELELHVGAAEDTLDMIARHTTDDLGDTALTGGETLNGSLMSASDFAIEDFRPTNGDLSRTVVAALRLFVLRNDEVVAEARHTHTFAVGVNDEELQVTATLGGTGEVVFETS